MIISIIFTYHNLRFCLIIRSESSIILEMKPDIKFELNKKLDYEMAECFLNDGKTAGFDFKKEILDMHPELKPICDLPKEEQKERIIEYIDMFYDLHKEDLENSRTLFINKWSKVQEYFYNASDKIFDNLEWPEGKYISYISILPIGPRFLDNKTFQTCWMWKDNLIGQVIHEMLHFQFYNLLNKTNTEADENKIWHLSEIFNDIIQREPEFVRIQGYIPKISYPDHEKEFDKHYKIWQETGNTFNFIKKALNKIY